MPRTRTNPLPGGGGFFAQWDMVLLLMRTARPGLLALFALQAMSAHAFARTAKRDALLATRPARGRPVRGG